jgi:hypothetical protein
MTPWTKRRSALWALAAAAGLLWWVGRTIPHRNGGAAAGLAVSVSTPAAGIPKPSRAVVINNETAKLKLAPDLEGIALVFPEDVAGLVASDGSFRTDLSLEKLSTILRIEPQSISKKDAAEVDPEAILFTAIAGRLSERAKALSRRLRETETRSGRPASAAGYEWVTAVIPFNLSALKRPNHEQKKMLDAISRSALGTPRQPGEMINAIPLPLSRAQMQANNVDFVAGYLPLEAPGPDPSAATDN